MAGKTSPVYAMPNGRFRSDDTIALNTDSGWNGAINDNINQTAGLLFRWRVEVEETAGGSGNQSFRLEFRIDQGGGYGAWTAVNRWDSGVAATPIQIWASSQFADGAATTNLLSGSAAAFLAGTGEWDGDTASLNMTSQHTEFEFTLLINKSFGAGPTFVANGNTIQLRMTAAGTVFGGTVNSPTITVVMDNNYLGGCTPETHGKFLTADGTNLYAFIESEEATADMMAMKKTDGGAWTDTDGANRPTSVDAEGFDIHFDGDTVHMAMFNRADNLVYHTFRTASHSTNPDTWGTVDESITTGLGSALFQDCAIAVRSDGDRIVFYNGFDGTNARVYYKINTGAGWGSELTLDSEASTAFNGVVCVMGASDTCHVFYIDRTNSHLYHNTIDSGGSLGTRQIIANGVIDNSPNRMREIIKPVYYDDGGTEVIIIAYRDNTAARLETVELRAGSPQTALTVFAADVKTDGGGGGMPVASISAEGVNTWMAVAPLSDADVDRTSSADGGAWDSLTSVVASINAIYVMTHIWTNGSGDTILGIIYDDDEQLETGNFGGFTGRLWYTEYTIATGGADPYIPLASRIRAQRFASYIAR